MWAKNQDIMVIPEEQDVPPKTNETVSGIKSAMVDPTDEKSRVLHGQTASDRLAQVVRRSSKPKSFRRILIKTHSCVRKSTDYHGA